MRISDWSSDVCSSDLAPPRRSYRLSSCFVTMSDRSSDPGLSGNLRRSFLPSRAPTSYHRDQGGRSRWRHLLRLLREERSRRRFCCRPALQRHWRSRPGGCKIARLDQLFRSHSVLARGVGKIEIFEPGSDLAIVAQLKDCDQRKNRK